LKERQRTVALRLECRLRVRFGAFAKPITNVRSLRIPAGWCRRQADIADCDSGRRSWGKLPVEKISKGCARQPFAAPTPVEGYNLTSEGSSSERCWSKRSNRAANHVGTFKHHNQRNNCLVDPYCELKYRAIILS
jgi:hypothetical protein